MIYLRTPDSKEFEEIISFIEKFELDNRDLQQHQFTAAFLEGNIVGFGRIREHENCSEICSLGTLSNYRNRGISKMIIQDLLKKAKQEIYIVCIIPDYFKQYGFEIVEEFPEVIQNKLDYCTCELVVPETYFVLKKI